MNILVVMPVTEKHKQWMAKQLTDVNIIYTRKPTEQQLAEAEVIVGNVAASGLTVARKLRLLQLNSAGADAYCNPGVMPEQAILANATGAYGLALSEYMLAVLLAMQKHLYAYHDNQRAHKWQDEGEVTSIFDSKAVIVGVGDIGTCFAKRLHALGAEVYGIRRRPTTELPAYLAAWGTLDKLEEYIADADIVANVLPGSKSTQQIFDRNFFAHMKSGAYFINAGRGSAVVEDDLYEALVSGKLRGAAIDVTAVEPLPEDSKLWYAPNLHITPHTAGQYHLPATHDNIIKIAIENIKHLQHGEAIRNQVDYLTGYKK